MAPSKVNQRIGLSLAGSIVQLAGDVGEGPHTLAALESWYPQWEGVLLFCEDVGSCTEKAGA